MEYEITVELGRAIVGINRSKKRMMDKKLDSIGIGGPPHLIIVAARKFPGCSQDFVGEYFALDKTTVARGAQKLENMGLLRRETSQEDRRQNELYLTEKGEEACKVIKAALTEWEQSLTRGFTQEELETASSLLSRMLESSKRDCMEPLPGPPKCNDVS